MEVYLLCVYQVGGRNTVLEKASMTNGIHFVSDVPTIVFGADVSHPPAGEESSPCIAAVSFLDGVVFEQPKWAMDASELLLHHHTRGSLADDAWHSVFSSAGCG